MKNIETLLQEAGLEIPEDKKESFNKSFNENYKTVNDYERQKEKLSTYEEKVNTLTESLDKFKDVDPDALNQKIDQLQKDLEAKDSEYAQKIADRDFDTLIRESIAGAKGKNVKAITALLDLDMLKASKNQKDDVAAALKALSEAEDSSFLFQAEDESNNDDLDVIGKGDVIGSVKHGGGDNMMAGLRSAMGLPAEEKK